MITIQINTTATPIEAANTTEGEAAKLRMETGLVSPDSDSEPLLDSHSYRSDARSFKGWRVIYAYYVLGLLMVAYVFHQFDRTIIVFLKDEIQDDIKFSEAEYGLLVGYGFAVLYGLCGIPFGFLADKYSRKLLLLAGLVFWSLMLVVQGFSDTYNVLLGARLGIGIGEASFNPAALALLTDYFPIENRIIPNSIFQFGVFLGTGIAAIVSEAMQKGWRWTLGGAGVLGCAVAVMILLTMREPPRGRYGDVSVSGINSFAASKSVKVYTYKQTFLFVISLNSPWRLCIAAGFRTIGNLVFLAFTPSFLNDTYTSDGINFYFGAITILGGVFASVLGAYTTKYWLQQDQRAPSFVCALSMIAAIPFVVLVFVAHLIFRDDDKAVILALSALFFAFLLCDASPGPSAFMFQSLLPAAMQASGFSLYFAVVTIIGGSGPELAGIILDRVASEYKFVPLLVVTCVAYLVSAIAYTLAAFTYEEDLISKELFEVGGEHEDVSQHRLVVFGCATAVVLVFMAGSITISFVL